MAIFVEYEVFCSNNMRHVNAKLSNLYLSILQVRGIQVTSKVISKDTGKVSIAISNQHKS